MQSQSVILLAEVRHNELQAEAARLLIVNQARARRPTAIDVAAGAARRFGFALTNAATRLHGQGAPATAQGNVLPAISGVGADALCR